MRGEIMNSPRVGRKRTLSKGNFLSPISLSSIYPIEDSKFLEQHARLFLQIFDIKPYRVKV